MEKIQVLTTREKALKINLNSGWYGSFAEIGAGQETAAHFFKAGGASGTIAKTMSAYDMKFSDAIYGKSKRYVCEDRLLTMLDHEYNLLEERLEKRAEKSCFFTFANTVEALNFKKANQGHGWIGVRFQLEPETPPNEVILHVVLKDNETIWQQEAIGIIGVNLIYACFHFSHNTDRFLATVMEGLSTDRIEVDFFRLAGPNFAWVDNRLLSLKLVKTGMTQAAMFGPDREVLHTSDVLYRKNVLVLRGRFRPPTHVNMDMLELAKTQFLAEEGIDEKNTRILVELTLKNLTQDGNINEQDFLDRVDLLSSMGLSVMISNYQEYYRLVSYLSSSTHEKKIGIALGVINLEQIFDEQYYTDLNGGILEAFGILFGANVKLYIYPALRALNPDLYTCENFELPNNELHHLFKYLFATRKITDMAGVKTSLLHITSDEVLGKIHIGDSTWESMVPFQVAKAIKELKLFDYQEEEHSTID